MKKILLITIAMLGILFTGCNNKNSVVSSDITEVVNTDSASVEKRKTLLPRKLMARNVAETGGILVISTELLEKIESLDLKILVNNDEELHVVLKDNEDSGFRFTKYSLEFINLHDEAIEDVAAEIEAYNIARATAEDFAEEE